MLGDTAGVRDEIGLLLVHQRYSDRFFPGTSVLHTRLRYVLFVPWLFERLRSRGIHGKDFLDGLQREETVLAERLKGEDYGVIGRLMLPDASNQPPSYVYWTALSTWGLIDRKPNGRTWSRADIGALAASGSGRILKDDDGRPLETNLWPIADLPAPPEGWDGSAPLVFDLEPEERAFLIKLIVEIRCPFEPEHESLLAMLAGREIEARACWEPAVLKHSGPHRAALKRAGRAASLGAIGRAVYAALVETQKERDGRAVGRRHRDALTKILDEHAEQVAGLDADLLIADLQPDLPIKVERVLRDTIVWVRRDGTDPSELLGTYRQAEFDRKGLRARLAEEQSGVDRRIEWIADEHPSAEPLHYRWDRVRVLLRDLAGA